MLNAVMKTVTLESGRTLDVCRKVALTDARVFLGTVTTKSYTCRACGCRRPVKSAHTDDVRALLVASKLCFACHTSLTAEPVVPVVVPVDPPPPMDPAIITRVFRDLRKTHKAETPPALTPVVPTPFPSRLAVQILRTDEDQLAGEFLTYTRHLYTEEMRAQDIDFVKEEYFMLHETRAMLDELCASHGTRTSGLPMVYGLLSLKAVTQEGKDAFALWFAGVTGQGHRKAHGVYDVATKTRYRAIFWDADSEITAILVPMDSDVYTLEDLGITLTSSPKAPKRVRRGVAIYDVMARLTVDESRTETLADGVRYYLKHDLFDRVFTVKVMDLGTLTPEDVTMVDGMGINKILSAIYGHEYDHVKQTVLLPKPGTFKGFGQNFDCWDHITDDAVLYGPKAEFKVVGPYAYIGSLGKLKETPAYMDIQSLCNMGMYELPLAPAEGAYQIDALQRIRFSENEAAIRDQDARFAQLADAKAERDAEYDEDGELLSWPEPDDMWAAVRAAKLMIETHVLPVLWRRSTTRALDAVVDVPRGRILMSRVMRRLNICPNPLAFNAAGKPCQDLDALTHVRFPDVPVGYAIVCIPDQPEGPVLMWRNPNTTKWEAVLFWNVHLSGLMRYAHKGFTFFGYEACEYLVRMNGADQDDNVLITSDPAYIAKWEMLEYPWTEKISADAVSAAARRNKYDEAEQRKQAPPTVLWNPLIGDLAIERWRTTKIGLGAVILACAYDTMFSGESLAHATAELAAGRCEFPDNFSGGDRAAFMAEALWHLQHRASFQNRHVAANSEYVIDWFMQHAGNEGLAMNFIKQSQQVYMYTDAKGKARKVPVFAMCNKYRIPRKRREAGDYILVETKVCAGLAPLAQQYADVQEAARRKEWKIVRPIPTEVDEKYYQTEFSQAAVKDLRKMWQEFRDAAKAAGHKNWYHVAANGYDVQQVIRPNDPDYNLEKAGTPQYRQHHIKGLRELYFYMQKDGKTVAMPLHLRLALAVEWLRQVYSVSILEPKKRPGEELTQSFGDGVPDYILHDYFTALEACHLTGLVVYVQLDPKAHRRLVADGQRVRVKVLNGLTQAWVITSDGHKVGVCPKLVAVPDGIYTMSPEGVIVVWKSNVQLHSDFKITQAAKRAAGVVDEVGSDFEDDDDDPYAVR